MPQICITKSASWGLFDYIHFIGDVRDQDAYLLVDVFNIWDEFMNP